MRILYIFPHPDDESFGPAGVIHTQVRDGHDVHLLTLTRGGATRQREKLGLSIEEMGDVRSRELADAAAALSIETLTVLDYPDSGLAEIDPRRLEEDIKRHIELLEPALVVTYPVHGGSGYHDHLVTHAVVKRTFLSLRENGSRYLSRLAFFTMPDSGGPSFLPDGWPRLRLSAPELIDCVVRLDTEDIRAMSDALMCYPTYRKTIETIDVLGKIGDRVHFEIFDESHNPPLTDLTEGLA